MSTTTTAKEHTVSTPTTALNPAAIVALQFEQEMYEMLRRAGVSEARIDAMRATCGVFDGPVMDPEQIVVTL